MTEHKEKHPHANKSEKRLDKEIEDSFPASDPPSTGGTTKIVPEKDSALNDRAATTKPAAH